MHTNSALFLSALALLGCATRTHTQTVAQSTGVVETRTSLPIPGRKDSAWMEVTVPTGVRTARAVVVFIDRELDRYAYDDRDWRAMCVRVQCALLRLGLPRTDAAEAAAQPVRNAALGGGAALLEALVVAARQTGHPEIASANVLLFGFSAAGSFGPTFAALYPERTIGFIRYHSNSRGLALDTVALSRIPALVIGGEKDDMAFVDDSRSLWTALRRRNAPWAFVSHVGQPHYSVDGLIDAGFVLRQWAMALINARTAVGSSTLRPWLSDSAWLVADDAGPAAPALSMAQPAPAMSWVPNGNLALGLRQLAGACATTDLAAATALLGPGTRLEAENSALCHYVNPNPKRDLWISASRSGSSAAAAAQLRQIASSIKALPMTIGPVAGFFAIEPNRSCSTLAVARLAWMYTVSACGEGFAVSVDSARLRDPAGRAAGLTPPASTAPRNEDTLRFTVFSQGQPIGTASIAEASSDAPSFMLDSQEGRRRTSLTTSVRLDARGVPTSTITRDRTDTTGKVINQFRSSVDTAPGFHLSELTADVSHSLLARALIRAPRRELPLLPVGRARLESEGSIEVHAGDRRTTVFQYVMHGIEFTPNRVWLDSGGRLFAGGMSMAGGEFSKGQVIRAGWENARGALEAADQRATADRVLRLAGTLRRRPSTDIVFRGALLFDATTRQLRSSMTVVVSGDRIAAVGADNRVPIPRDAEVIDARGKTLIPGLWDMHSHALGQMRWTLFQLAVGITTVREMTLDTLYFRAMMARPREELEFGPRIIPTGFIDGPEGRLTVRVETAADARAIVQRYAALGIRQLKLYNTVPPAVLPVIVEEAQRHGMRVSGHMPKGITVQQAVDIGFDEINHVQFLALNFRGNDPNADFFHAVGRHSAELDLSADSVRRLVTLMRNRGVALDPTLAITETLLTLRDGMYPRSLAPVIERFPALVQPRWLGEAIHPPDGLDERYRASFRTLQMLVKQLHDAGVTILPGSDGTLGFGLQRELELYVEAGIPVTEVIYLATLGAARIMKREADLGSVSAGKYADLVLLDGDLRTDVGALRRVVVTMKGGAIYDPVDLHAALGIEPTAARRKR